MKLSITKLKVIPNSTSFGLCCYGKVSDEIQSWIDYWKLPTETTGNYTNIYFNDTCVIEEMFDTPTVYKYMDGFSPNLNKLLHIGHASNLVLAKAFKSLGVCENTVSIYGDTLKGSITKEDALAILNHHYKLFNCKPDIEYMASEMVCPDILVDGEGEYINTKVFNVGDSKVVGIKSNGSTSYFYQDVALATLLNAPTLYLTGKEQVEHFKSLKVLFPHITHIGLGLVTINGKKMSSRTNTVITFEDLIAFLIDNFNDMKLIYNIIAGLILKSNPDVDKSIDIQSVTNPKNSEGLYLSYTIARLKSAGCTVSINSFTSKRLEYAYLKSKTLLSPNILFKELVDYCKMVSVEYTNKRIEGNDEHKKLFNEYLSNLVYGMTKLGMFDIKKV